jgi:hypothetical protein
MYNSKSPPETEPTQENSIEKNYVGRDLIQNVYLNVEPGINLRLQQLEQKINSIMERIEVK